MTLKTNPNTEKYLFVDYQLIEHTTLLKEERDIETFFTENTEFLGDREDGYSEEEEFLVKIDDKYYEVTVEADVYNLGGNDDLWACDVTEVNYVEVQKPLPKERKSVVIEMQVTDEVLSFIEAYLNTKGCSHLRRTTEENAIEQLRESEHTLMNYLGQSLRNFEYVGNILNNMDAVTEHDESQTFDLSEAREYYDKNCERNNLPNTDELFGNLVYIEE